MHVVCLGVGKQLSMVWIVCRKQPYSMPKANIEKLSELLIYLAKHMPHELYHPDR